MTRFLLAAPPEVVARTAVRRVVVAGSASPRWLRRTDGVGLGEGLRLAKALSSSACSFRARTASGELSENSSSSASLLSTTSRLRLLFMENKFWRRPRFGGSALTAGKCTSILFGRVLARGCSVSLGVAAEELLVRGVVYPLPDEGVAEVKMDDESDATLDALRRLVCRFAMTAVLSCGGAAKTTGVSHQRGEVSCFESMNTPRLSVQNTPV